MKNAYLKNRVKNNFKVDIGIIFLSVIVAILLVQTGVINEFLKSTEHLLFLDSFIAGLFFTSIFTTAPAIATLGQIAQTSDSLVPVVLFGGFGALFGDLIIFRFMRDRFDRDIVGLINYSGNGKLRHIIRMKVFRWITFFLGALVISSPLPDELGLAMMGLSKAKMSTLIPVSLIFNSLGILAIALVARNLA